MTRAKQKFNPEASLEWFVTARFGAMPTRKLYEWVVEYLLPCRSKIEQAILLEWDEDSEPQEFLNYLWSLIPDETRKEIELALSSPKQKAEELDVVPF